MKCGLVDAKPKMYLKKPVNPDDVVEDDAPVFLDEKEELLGKYDQEKYYLEVNFSECAAVFLSSYFTRNFFTLEAYKAAPLLVDQFLDYLLDQRVCPEYTSDIQEAKMICAKARKELPASKMLLTKLPSKRDLAINIHFGGSMKNALDVVSSSSFSLEQLEKSIGITKEQYLKIIAEFPSSCYVEQPQQVRLKITGLQQEGMVCQLVDGEEVYIDIEEELKPWVEVDILMDVMLGELKQESGKWWWIDQVIDVFPSYYKQSSINLQFDGYS